MQNRGTCCLKKCFNTERSKGNFLRENLKKNSIANENALNSEGVLKYNKASQAIQSPRTVPFFLLVSLLDGYSFPNVLVKGIVAFKH